MKLKRLVSAVLAVGMALTMLPTAAFAATPTTPKYVQKLTFIGDAPYFDPEQTTTTTKTTTSGSIITTVAPTDKNVGWSWSDDGGSYKLNILSGYTYDIAENNVPAVIPCQVRVTNGIVNSGRFEKKVFNFGIINGGEFEALESRGSGSVVGGYIREYVSDSSYPNTSIANAIVYGNVKFRAGSLTNSIISNVRNSGDSSDFVQDYQTFVAEGGLITPVITGETVPDNVVFQGKVYLVGSTVPTRTFTVKPASPTFVKWEIVSQNGATIVENADNSLTVTLPDNSTNAGDITIKAVMEPVPLEVGVVDGEKVPVYNGEFYAGSDLDGWYFDRKNETLTVYENGSVDLGSNEVDWTVNNYGKIEGGIFDYKDDLKDFLTNEDSGVIDGGTFNVKVRNYGTIDGGTFNNSISNYSLTNGGTFIGRFSNILTQTAQSDGSINATADYSVKGGIFSRYANFDTQDVKLSWVTLNNCTANGISGMVGVVGNQTLKIEADATSWTGWEVTADPAYEDAINKQVCSTSAFDLTLNGDDEWSVTLTAQVKEGYYRMNLTDGTATNADGTEITSAKAGDTVKLTAADAPDGMVFDRWEITPSDVALTLEEAGFDSHAATASFKMPAQTLNIRAMYRMADQPEEPNVLGTVAMVATAGVGAAVVGYTGYMIGTELYLNTVLPEGVAIPNNATELAVLVWNDAGKPAPAAVLAADATDEQKALTWAVENQLISADKAADASVGRWEVIDAWNKAQEMKKV